MSGLQGMDSKLIRQYTSVYGPYVTGEHAIGQEITTAQHGGGLIIWSYRDTDVHALAYVVDSGDGWPIVIKASNVTQI